MTTAPDIFQDTIYALSSGYGRAGVAVVRASGAHARAGLERIAGVVPPPRTAALVWLRHPETGARIDRALVLWFPAPHSFTGEDVVEFHTHGSVAVMDALLAALACLPRHRLAQAGEFTRRAFDNGKMDLTGVEGLQDVIDAQTPLQLGVALAQMDGALGALYENWRERLVTMLAHMEAEIEFSDDDSLDASVMARTRRDLVPLRDDMARHLDDGHRGEILRDGVRVAVVGPPNAGKSSLLNALARRDVAIVSPVAGTTRDVIEARLNIAGMAVIVCDTAGLRDSGDAIEREGVRRALDAAARAHLTVCVVGADQLVALDAAAQQMMARADLVVINKIDLDVEVDLKSGAGGAALLKISVADNVGMDGLLRALEKKVQAVAQLKGADLSAPLMTRARHREHLTSCVASLDRAAVAQEAELAAEDIRLATRALGAVTGRVDVEDLLDVVFRDFCVGK